MIRLWLSFMCSGKEWMIFIYKLIGLVVIFCLLLVREIRDSIPGRVIPKTQKMVLDDPLLNIEHYTVWIKGKVEQIRERSSALDYWKGSLRVALVYGRQLCFIRDNSVPRLCHDRTKVQWLYRWETDYYQVPLILCLTNPNLDRYGLLLILSIYHLEI